MIRYWTTWEGNMTVIKHTCQGTNDISHSHRFLLMGCESTAPKTAIGGLGGAAAGGLLGAALGGNGTGIAAGAILGGLLGGPSAIVWTRPIRLGRTGPLPKPSRRFRRVRV